MPPGHHNAPSFSDSSDTMPPLPQLHCAFHTNSLQVPLELSRTCIVLRVKYFTKYNSILEVLFETFQTTSYRAISVLQNKASCQQMLALMAMINK